MPANAIGDGRKVKCKACKHIWFQAPLDVQQTGENTQAREIEQNKRFEESLSAEDVPRAIRPDQASDSDLGRESKTQENNTRVIALPLYSIGGIAAILVFVLIVLVGFRQSLVQAQPGMNSFYGLFGVSVALPGKDLVFDRLSHSKLADGTTLRISGALINLSDKPRQTTNIKLIPLDGNGIILEDPLIFSLPKITIEGEAQRPFLIDYPNYPSALRDIELALTMEKPAFEGRLPHNNQGTVIAPQTEVIIREDTPLGNPQDQPVNPHRLRLITDDEATPPPQENAGDVMQFELRQDNE